MGLSKYSNNVISSQIIPLFKFAVEYEYPVADPVFLPDLGLVYDLRHILQY